MPGYFRAKAAMISGMTVHAITCGTAMRTVPVRSSRRSDTASSAMPRSCRMRSAIGRNTSPALDSCSLRVVR
ncbi:hypothetical protein D3C87_969430 [compost metagenome]